MNIDSLPICEEVAKRGGLLLVNSSLVKGGAKRKDLKVVEVPCNEIAESIGDVKIANMVMMGALSKATGAVKLDKLESVLAGFFGESKRKFIPMNMKAIEAGRAAV